MNKIATTAALTIASLCLGASLTSAGTMKDAMTASFKGPEKKKLKIHGHEFNIKPVEIYRIGDKTVVNGHISHHLSVSKDDQVYYQIIKVGDAVQKVEKGVSKGGWSGLSANIISAAGLVAGQSIPPEDIEKRIDRIEKAIHKSWTGACDAIIANVALRVNSDTSARVGNMEKAVQAALKGPEKKKLKVFGYEFNIKPATIEKVNGRTLVDGRISHHISNRPDDQVLYRFVKEGNEIKDLQRDIERGGVAGVLPGKYEEKIRGAAKSVEGNWELVSDLIIANIGLMVDGSASNSATEKTGTQGRPFRKDSAWPSLRKDRSAIAPRDP